MPTIGFLVATDDKIWKKYIDAFENQLKKLGWKKVSSPTTDPKDVYIVYKSAKGDSREYKKIAEKFVTDRVDIIVTSGTAPALACKEATAGGMPAIPVVFASAGDPDGSGLRTDGGNVAGGWNEQVSKDMVKARVAHLLDQWSKGKSDPINKLGVVYNDLCPPSASEATLAVTAAKDSGVSVVIAPVRTQQEIKDIASLGVDALYVCSDPVITEFSDDLKDATKKIFTAHGFAEYYDDHGGSCSYGPNLKDMFGMAAVYACMILTAQNPAEHAGNLPLFTAGKEQRPKAKVLKRPAARGRSSGKRARPRARR